MTTIPETDATETTNDAVLTGSAIAQVLSDPEARAAHMQARARQLAEARRIHADLYAERQASYELWEQEHVELLDDVAQAAANVNGLEAAIRRELEQCYHFAKAEHPDKPAKAYAPGLGVRVGSELRYNEIPALAWCKANMPLLVETIERLKERAFLALIESTPELLDNEAQRRIDLRHVERVTPTIAKDLAALLPKPTPAPYAPDEPDAAGIAAAEADAMAAAEAYDVHQYETSKELPF